MRRIIFNKKNLIKARNITLLNINGALFVLLSSWLNFVNICFSKWHSRFFHLSIQIEPLVTMKCMKMCMKNASLGVIHKLRGQFKGEGGLAKWSFYNISLFCESGHEGWGGVKIPKNLTTWFMNDPFRVTINRHSTWHFPASTFSFKFV